MTSYEDALDAWLRQLRDAFAASAPRSGLEAAPWANTLLLISK